MPIALHQHLKRGLQYEILDAEPFKADAEDPDNCLTTEEHSAKQQRIEFIAAQYLKGNAPLILSARLKGPFDKRWTNPWARKRKNAKGKSNARAREVRGEQAPVEDDASINPSPEASRATRTILDYHTQSTARQSPTTASRVALQPPSHEPSGGSEYFSANVEPDVTRQDFGSDSTWLKRPVNSRMRGTSRKDSGLHPSPTPTRVGNVPIDSHGKIQLAFPKASGARVSLSSTLRPPVPGIDWMSSASAPMDISSPVKPSSAVRIRHPVVASNFAHESSNRSARSAGTRSVVGSQDDLTESQNIALFEQPSCNGRERPPPRDVTEVAQGSPLARAFGSLGTVNPGPDTNSKARRPSRDDVRRSAERCITRPVTSQTLLNKRGRNSKTTYDSILPVPCGPKLVASPAPNSSIGFEYQKVQKVRSGPRKAQKRHPKPIDFQSSPQVNRKGNVIVQEIVPPSVVIPKDDLPQNHADENARDETLRAMPPPRPDVYDIRAIEQDRDGTASSRQSIYSTQAAMLLAQLDFQDGSFLSAASETPRTLPVLRENELQQAHMHELNEVSMTPFHAFNAELDKSQPTNDITADVPISTQDLFSAASPYTFSTVKKKTARTARSSLRFAVHPSPPPGDDGHANTVRHKSPSPSGERIPLKERNSKVSIGSNMAGSEKRSQASTWLPAISPASPTSPKLGNLLDDLDLNGSFTFTSNFMKNINGIT